MTWAHALRLGRLNALVTWWPLGKRRPFFDYALDYKGFFYISLGALEVSFWLGRRWR